MIVALTVLPFGMLPGRSSAASISSYSDTIDDSRPSNDTSHEIYFVTPTGVESSTDTITLTFPSGFDLTSVDFGDMDLAEDNDGGCDGGWTEKTLAATPNTDVWGAAIAGQVITFTAPSNAASGEIDAGFCVQIEIGDNATGGATNEEINNHSTGAVYDISVGGTFGDTGTMKIVVIATITAQVTVDETLTFTVTAQTPAQCADYDDTPGTEITTTAVLIDFGTPAANAFIDGCQELDIDTNASNGYSVTVQESDQLASGGDTIPDGTCDGACSEITENQWATATNNGLGYCMEDVTGNGATTADGGWGTNGCDATDTYFKIFPEKDIDATDIETIMSSASEVNDVADIGYRLTIPGTQPAGVYTNNIIFVATPNY